MNAVSTSFDVTAMVYCAVMAPEKDRYEYRVARLRQLLEAKHVADSTTAAGRLLHKPARQVTDWLSGRRVIGEKIARELERQCDLPPRWFEWDITPQEGELLEIFRQFDETTQDALLSSLRATARRHPTEQDQADDDEFKKQLNTDAPQDGAVERKSSHS